MLVVAVPTRVVSVKDIVTVLPDPEVVIPPLPNTFKTFTAGTAVPESVTNEVATEGLPETALNI